MTKKKNIAIVAAIIVLLTGAAVFGVYYYMYQHKSVLHRTIPQVPNIHHDGIDVSHHQGRINWQAVAKDTTIRFVYIKASEGTSVHDKSFKRNAQNAHKHGIKVGAYHLLTTKSSPETQFQNFLKNVGDTHMDLIPTIDIEANLLHDKKMVDYAKRLSSLMQKHYGCKPLIYTSSDIYNLRLHPDFASYYLWISAYSRRCPLLKGKTRINIWQYTERGHINGYAYHIDLNCFVNGMTIDKLLLR